MSYKDVAAATGFEIGHIYDIASVSRRVPPSLRTDKLLWSHHRAVSQCRREYLQLAPAALDVVKKALLQAQNAGEVSRDAFGAALQILRGTGVHEERVRSRSDVRVTNDFSSESNEQLIGVIDQLLKRTQPQGTS